MAYVPPLNGGRINASIGGNSTSAGAGYSYISTGNMLLAGGNNITLSQNGSAITISGANAPVANINLSAGTTSNNLSAVTFSNSNNVNFGLNGSVVTASVSSSLTNIRVSAGAASNNLSAITFSNANGVGFGLNGSVITASHNALTTARASTDGIGLNTAQTNVTWTADSRGISLNAGGYAGTGFSGTNASGTMNSNGLQLSVGAGGGGGGIALNDGVNGINTGTARISGGGALTASINGQTLSLNVPPVSSVSATGAVSISTNGSTVSIGAPAFSVGISSNSTVSNQFILAAGNNITLSQSTDATGATVSVGANGVLTSQSNQVFSAGNGSFAFQTASFSNANGVSFSTTANGATSGIIASLNTTGYAGTGFSGTNATGTLNSNGLQLSVGAGGGGGGLTLYDGANSITGGTARISGGGALTASVSGQTLSLNAPPVSSLSVTGALSISTSGSTISLGAPQTSSLVGTGGAFISANGSTISIGAMPTLSRWEHPNQVFTTVGAPINNTMSLHHMYVPFNVTGQSMRVAAAFTVANITAATTASANISVQLGIYTLNGSTLQSVSTASANNGFSWTASAQSSQFNSLRQLTVPININMTPGEYWVGAIINTAITYSGITLSMYGDNQIGATGAMGNLGANITASARDVILGQGLYGTAALPSTVAMSAIVNSGTQAMRAGIYNAIYNATY